MVRTSTLRRVIPIDDNGVVVRSPVQVRRPVVRTATTASVQARAATQSSSVVQRVATQMSLVRSLQSVISTGVRVANLAVRAFEPQTAAGIRLAANGNTQAANNFMYAQGQDEDVFEEVYALGLQEYDSERTERRRLMGLLTGGEEIPLIAIAGSRQNLSYSNRRASELRRGLDLYEERQALDAERRRLMAQLSGEGDVSSPLIFGSYQRLNDANRGLASVSDSRREQLLLESVMGYNIEFNDMSSEAQSLRQLQNLAASSLQIIDYIDSVVSPEAGLNNVDIFTRFYTRSRPTENSTRTSITIYLGADDILQDPNPNVRGEEYTALTPMPINNRDAPEELGRLYLGSQVSAGTIMHELTHQIDRYFDGRMSENFATYLAEQTSGQFGITYTQVMRTRAARTNIEQASEQFADFGMTAYADIAPGQFYVESDNPSDVIGFRPDYAASSEMSEVIDDYFAYIFGTGQLPE